MNDQPMHPNLARIAASYDQILSALHRNQLSIPEARAQIARLEARDDQGVRWSIDPDTGQFMRKTAFGDSEYDTPPTSGVRTTSPHDINPDPQSINPDLFLRHTQADPALVTPPLQLAGATRHLGGARQAGWRSTASVLVDRIASLPGMVKIGACVLVLVLCTVLFTGGDDKDEPASSPTTSQEQDKAKPAKSKKSSSSPASSSK